VATIAAARSTGASRSTCPCTASAASAADVQARGTIRATICLPARTCEAATAATGVKKLSIAAPAQKSAAAAALICGAVPAVAAPAAATARGTECAPSAGPPQCLIGLEDNVAEGHRSGVDEQASSQARTPSTTNAACAAVAAVCQTIGNGQVGDADRPLKD